MKRRDLLFYLFLVLIFAAKNTFSQEYTDSLDIRIPLTPSVVTIGGKPTVYYELFITNFSNDSISLNEVEVLNTSDSQTIFKIDKENLLSKQKRIGLSKKNNDILQAGETITIYLEYSLPKGSSKKLNHQIKFQVIKNEIKKDYSIRGETIEFSDKSELVLGAPLRGGEWAAIYEPVWERGHRRVFYTIDGKARIPGRFAIDFIKLDKEGKYASGDEDVIANWFGYGVDVIAVADGKIASTKNNVAESATVSSHPKYSADQATGNYISINIGNGNFAFYEHLKPGSIKVKEGQKVKKGDVIASLGFTGQTTGPHLHFHVANNNSPLGAEGIPFVFEKFREIGFFPNLENLGKKLWVSNSNPNKSKIVGERPSPNSVIRFD